MHRPRAESTEELVDGTPGQGQDRCACERPAPRAGEGRAAMLDRLFERLLELDFDGSYPFVGRC